MKIETTEALISSTQSTLDTLKNNQSVSQEDLDLDAMAAADETEKARIAEELKAQEQQSYKERIEALTEKFKNDPVKLAVLSKLAQELNDVE